jgi:hypothetical protein
MRPASAGGVEVRPPLFLPGAHFRQRPRRRRHPAPGAGFAPPRLSPDARDATGVEPVGTWPGSGAPPIPCRDKLARMGGFNHGSAKRS